MSASEVAENIISAVKSRMASPLLGSFILSWPVVNHRLMLILFGEGSFPEKLDYIANKLYSGWFQEYLNLFVAPLLFASFYTFIYPYIDKWLTLYAVRRAAEKARDVLIAERKIPFDENDQLKYFEQYENIKIDYINLVKQTNEDAARRNADSLKVIQGLLERLGDQVALAVAKSCDIDGNDRRKLVDCLIGVGIEDNIDLKKKFKKYRFYNEIKAVAEQSKHVGLQSGTARKIITVDWVVGETNVREGIGDLMESLLAFKVISVADYAPLIYMAQDNGTIDQILYNFRYIDAIQDN